LGSLLYKGIPDLEASGLG